MVVLNDPGRLLAVHLVHTSLCAGWSSVMLLYELLLMDTSDSTYNPIWRQGAYVMPFASRLGVVRSSYGWSISLSQRQYLYWSYECVSLSHVILSGLIILASCWHWAYSDLDVFLSTRMLTTSLDLNRVFGIHLLLSSILCMGYGLSHLSGLFGPGMYTSDLHHILGSVRFVKPTLSLIALSTLTYAVIPSHHIVAGCFGILVSLWHISSTPSPALFQLMRMGNLEAVLSTSIVAVFYASFVTSATMWYGSATSPHELYGCTRYDWDNAFFSLNIESRVAAVRPRSLAWNTLPDALVLYDYIGCNPSKGGLFRSGPLIKGHGVIQNWIGHASFSMGTLSLAVRRMPAFFETFPVILIDQSGTVRADISFRRGSSTYGVEQLSVRLSISGGTLNGVSYSSGSLVKNYARKAQFGEIFTFEKKTASSDGLWRTSIRGWYSFSHVTFSFIFLFGHLWHAARSLFKDVWTGVLILSQSKLEYGRNEKLGDDTTTSKTSAFI
jgi:photosystem II CP47 chlorophyll apoprotein